MDHEETVPQHCANMAAHLNTAEGWGLRPEEEQALADIAAACVPARGSDAQIRAALANIRRDRPAVEAMRQSTVASHQEEWSSWMGQARAILRRANLHWASDSAVDIDDLAQIALLELARSLPGFRYQSRFSTWAYQVIVGGVRRHLRDMSALKRSGDIDPDADPEMLVCAVGEGDLPETQAQARLLTEAVNTELTEALGRRNAEVFRLWACNDLSAEVIGQRVGLSAARVYAVLAQARQYLRGREAIRGWGDLPGE